MSRNIKYRNGDCGECKYFVYSEEVRKRTLPYTNDGWCSHPINYRKNGVYPVYSKAHCCFQAEDPDEYVQMELEDMFKDQLGGLS